MPKSEDPEKSSTASGASSGNDTDWQSTIPVIAIYGKKWEASQKKDSQGSALVVGPNLLLTAYHVVEADERVRIRVPNLKEPGRYDFLDASRISFDPLHDLALLQTEVNLELSPAVLVGNLTSVDLEELNQFHREKLLSWRCFGFPGKIEAKANGGGEVDVWHDAFVSFDATSEFGKPTPYEVKEFSPEEGSRMKDALITDVKMPWLGIPAGESGGAMLVRLHSPGGVDDTWYALGLNRLGNAGAASSNVRLFEDSQAVFTSGGAQIQLQSKDDLLRAFGLDLDSVLQRRSQRCCDEWERTWTRMDFVDDSDDESRWLAFYVPPHYSKFVRPQRVSKGVELDPIDHPNIDKSTHSPPTASGEKPNDGWEQVPGEYEEERLANLVKPQHLVVFEGPGAGKTIFTKRIEAFFCSETGQRLQSEKPLLVIRQASWESDWSTAFEKELLGDTKGCESYAKRLVEQAKKEGRLVWILDALDQLSDQMRDATLGSIRNFLLSDGGNQIRVIVTSRPGAVQEQLGKFLKSDQQISAGFDWNYARIEPFSVAQQYRYLYGPEKPGQQASDGQDPWSARQLDWEAIDRHRIVPPAINVLNESMIESIASKVSNYRDGRIQQLMSNPAILAMIRGLAQDGDLPTFNRRADLYKVVSRRMIERALARLPIDHTMDPDRVEEILAALAFASMMTDPSRHEFRGNVVKRIRDLASKRLAERVQPKDWNVVDQMPGKTSRSFLLSSMESELRWSHKGVMEFHCGRFLSYNNDPSWCSRESDSDWPVCRDRSIWQVAANPQWEEAFRFAIELGLSTEPNGRNEEVLLASLGMLYELPAKETGWERPTRLMFEAWSLLEKLPRRDWYDAIEPLPLQRGSNLIERFRRQFQEIKDDPNHLGYEVAQAMLGNFRPCPPSGNDDPQRLRFKIGDDLADATIEAAFELNAFAVTNQEYELLDAAHKRVRKFANNSVPDDDDLARHPVIRISWYSAWCFCQWLGFEYRLPNEKEWEYACRAGTDTEFNVGPELKTTDANFNKNMGHTTPVGSCKPNKFELHDMHGNVWEWCANWYGGSLEESVNAGFRPNSDFSARVLRGGSWSVIPLSCRSACRNLDHPTNRNHFVGFRVARAWSRKS